MIGRNLELQGGGPPRAKEMNESLHFFEVENMFRWLRGNGCEIIFDWLRNSFVERSSTHFFYLQFQEFKDIEIIDLGQIMSIIHSTIYKILSELMKQLSIESIRCVFFQEIKDKLNDWWSTTNQSPYSKSKQLWKFPEISSWNYAKLHCPSSAGQMWP